MQFGISYISAFLKAHSHSTRLIVLSRMSGKENEKIINEYIVNFKPGLICLTSVATEFNFISDIAKYIKLNFPGIYLIGGGPHISLNPQQAIDSFDALCIGEGENPILELVGQLEGGKKPSGIQNLWLKNGSLIEKNPTRPFMQNLDDLPFPDRHMWEEWIEEEFEARQAVLLGRGCPFECTYCSNHSLKKIAAGTYTRFRSTENILTEIKTIIKEFPEKKEIYLEVESINIDKTWVLELCSKLKGLNDSLAQPLSYGANVRITPNFNFKEIFHAFKKSNFRFINIGLESGSERLRHEVLKRNYSNEEVISAVRSARECGLRVSFLNMLGFPGETFDDFKETIRVNRICQPDWMGLSIFYPYQGTILYSVCQKDGLLEDKFPSDVERIKAVLDLPTFRRAQIENNYIWFEYNVFKGHKPLHKLLLKVAYLKIKANPYLFLICKKLKNLLKKASVKSR